MHGPCGRPIDGEQFHESGARNRTLIDGARRRIHGSSCRSFDAVGASTKVCQLTGETDWVSGLPTDAKTQTRYGLQGIDLGFPVESDTGELYFLFGEPLSSHGDAIDAQADAISDASRERRVRRAQASTSAG